MKGKFLYVLITISSMAFMTACVSDGDDGSVGLEGPQGIQGEVGATGEQGIQGPVGATGAQGIQGKVGATGEQGIQGEVGDTGEQGIQGELGGTYTLIVQQIMPTGAPGGFCTTNPVGIIREMNTLSGDLSYATLADDILSLDEGVYIVNGEAPGYYTARHKAFLQNETAGQTAVLGSSAFNYPGPPSQNSSSLHGIITVPAGEVHDFTLRHWCEQPRGGTFSLGYPTLYLRDQPEIYGQLVFTKIQ